MSRMGRPKTAASEYERVSVRLPPELLAGVRGEADESGRPLNTEIMFLLRDALRLRKPLEPLDRQRQAVAR